MTLQELKAELDRRIDAVDFEAAKADVQPFIVDASELALWGKPFFREIAQRLCSYWVGSILDLEPTPPFPSLPSPRGSA